jgi:hypothetical protein
MKNTEARHAATEGLKKLSNHLQHFGPVQLSEVVALLRDHPKFKLRGMQDPTALPVRTTFLHFTSPNAIPIFDKQVLLAVGVSDKYANQKLDYLRLYFPHVFALTERYAQSFSPTDEESPLRLVDMALWVTKNSPEGRNTGCLELSAS